MDRLALPRDDFSDGARALSHEWLVTNGLGGFASGTVAQANTRRYHGLLVASLKPPVDRIVMLAKLDATARYAGQTYDLACNEFSDGTIAPHGYKRLAAFCLVDQSPQWTFSLGDAVLEQRIAMVRGANTCFVYFTLKHATSALELELLPLCTYRDYHAHTRGDWSIHVDGEASACIVTAFDGARPYSLSAENAQFVASRDWYRHFHHRIEAQRGLDANEDLFRPGFFHASLRPGQSLTFIASCEPDVAADSSAARKAAGVRTRQLTRHLPKAAPAWVADLTLAADDFIAARVGADGRFVGTTVIAGYPWFSDWGRDTMIALPGLTLATQRQREAAEILRTFSRHVSQGMLPNRFPDDGEAAEYNTVDATLWYFHAIDCYLAATHDDELLKELYPLMLDIMAWHERGTRHGIRVDPQDGLLFAGEPGVQLTWMDAKVGDWVVTPRIGKPVEINALWHFANEAMARWSSRLGDSANASRYATAAGTIASQFRARFWNAERLCLYDVIDIPGSESPDASRRPNQIFAVSLGRGLLDSVQSRAVVDACARDLLTPVGLRSLAPSDPAYVSHYEGGPLQRDGSYHQGTVWSWLLGPFALAHFQVHGDADHALALLEQLAPHLAENCVGQISEIFDAEAPHSPRGCFAQAWSVAETLRAWHVLTAAKTPRTRSDQDASQT